MLKVKKKHESWVAQESQNAETRMVTWIFDKFVARV